jgi:L-serine dehydratase
VGSIFETSTVHMETLSVFDIFKIGVGPSSSHTLGPWLAAKDFISDLPAIDIITIHLYGSLSKTGIGHATDQALVLGLLDYDPKTIDTRSINSIIQAVKDDQVIKINQREVAFDFDRDIHFEGFTHELHPNTLKLSAFSNNTLIKEKLYASVGGGFIESPDDQPQSKPKYNLPHPIQKGCELLKYTAEHQCNISDIVLQNELSILPQQEIDQRIEEIEETFLDCIYAGCTTEGILPGGLNVVRRASRICKSLLRVNSFESRQDWLSQVKKVEKSFNCVNKWISCFALAINEENADMGRVVTSPTNGAAGVVPTVLMYYYLFCGYTGKESIRNYLLTAGEIGCLFKKGATISAAVGGCQAEIGVSSAMAAAGLTEVLGGTPEQCLMAAEIAMEHHLGLTCDPVNGLVQVPCIERNTMGAMKAITAANLALESDPKDSKVSLDAAIETMWQTSLDMNSKYKETSEGGLAMSLPVINPNC